MSRIAHHCLAALVRSAASHGLTVSADVSAAWPWSSALFVGRRLIVALAGDCDERLDQWLAALADADLPIRGHFVASAEVVERSDRTASVELLVVEG